jgi:hypothetical protein
LTNDEIFDAITNLKPKIQNNDDNRVDLARGGKSAWTKEQLDGKPVSGVGHPGYFTGKKLNREKFTKALNAYLGGTGVTQAQAAKMAGLSCPTFMKYANMLYTDGRLDGSHFKDNIGVEISDTSEDITSNDYILDRITKEG